MAFYREHLLLVTVVVFMGGMIFLRLIAKEKYRRERHLELRLAAKLKEQEEQEKKEREAMNAAKRQAGDSAPITLQPVS